MTGELGLTLLLMGVSFLYLYSIWSLHSKNKKLESEIKSLHKMIEYMTNKRKDNGHE